MIWPNLTAQYDQNLYFIVCIWMVVMLMLHIRQHYRDILYYSYWNVSFNIIVVPSNDIHIVHHPFQQQPLLLLGAYNMYGVSYWTETCVYCRGRVEADCTVSYYYLILCFMFLFICFYFFIFITLTFSPSWSLVFFAHVGVFARMFICWILNTQDQCTTSN